MRGDGSHGFLCIELGIAFHDSMLIKKIEGVRQGRRHGKMSLARIRSKQHVVDRGVKQLRGYRYNAPVSIPYDMKSCELDVQGLGLTRLPPLPHNLRTLICSNNNLETLPNLPPGLTTLACDENILKSLPALPKTLLTLDCSGNFLKEIPELPASLSVLVCYANELKFLPDVKNVTLLKGLHNPWNPRFAEIMRSEDCIQMIREFYRNMRLTKEIARNALNVTMIQDRLPDDLVNIVGSFMTGKVSRLDTQLLCLYEGVMDANDSLVADKNEVRKRVGSMAVKRGWWLKWHKEKLGLL